jgi:hypothetical protein
VTYSNNLEKIETIRDDGLIEGADPTIAALTGRIDVRFADTTLIGLAADGTPIDLEGTPIESQTGPHLSAWGCRRIVRYNPCLDSGHLAEGPIRSPIGPAESATPFSGRL